MTDIQDSQKTIVKNIIKNVTQNVGVGDANITIIHNTNIHKKEVKKNPIVFDVVKPVKWFTGREDQLTEIHSALQNASTEAEISRVVAITGTGGVGKTEICKKYTDQYKENYKHLIWINAENRENLVDSFRRLYHKITNQNTKENIKYCVEKIFNRIDPNDETLWIFDNAENFKDIEDFLPKIGPQNRKFYIIINSRYQEWEIGERGNIKILKLCEFTEYEAVRYVKNRLETEENSQIKKLVEMLQNFPLALKQAVGYISQENRALKKYRNKEFKIAEYIKEFSSSAKNALNKSYHDDFYKNTIYTTWKITIEKIKNCSEYGKIAIDFLHIIAYLDPEVVIEEFLDCYMKIVMDDPDKERQLQEALSLLDSYSMIDIRENYELKKVLTIHRLIQQVMRISLEEQNEEDKALEKTLEMLKFFNAHVVNKHATATWTHASKYDRLVKAFYSQSRYGHLNSTPLHLFVENHVEEIKELVKNRNGVDVDSEDLIHRTPLHIAVEQGHLDGINCLVTNGANNDISMDYLLRRYFMGPRNTYEYIFLHPAVMDEFQIGTSSCIENQASYEFHVIDEKDHTVQATILFNFDHVIIKITNSDDEIYSFLADLINGLNSKHTKKSIVLHNKKFYKANGDIILKFNEKDKKFGDRRMTYLHVASSRDQLEVVKHFIREGEDPKLFDINGQMPLHLAVEKGHIIIVDYFITEKEFDVDIRNDDGETSLHIAARSGHMEMIKYLIQKGANINAFDGFGLTPVYAATGTENSEVIEYLLNLEGIRLTCREDSLLGKLNTTLLQFAVMFGKANVIAHLKLRNDDEKCNFNVGNIDKFLKHNLDRLTDSSAKSLNLTTFNFYKNICSDNEFLCDIQTYDRSDKRSIIEPNLKLYPFRSQLNNFLKQYPNVASTLYRRLKNKSKRLAFVNENLKTVKKIPNFKIIENELWSLTAPTSNFVGRKTTLCMVHDSLQSNGIVVVTGVAGVGKTELARKYVKLYENFYTHIFWIQATRKTRVIRTFQSLTHRIFDNNNEINYRSIAKDVYQYFNTNGRSLFVFDDAKDYESVCEFLPKNGCVLINSRCSDWKSKCINIELIELKDFTKDEAVEYVTNESVIKQNNKDILKLSETLRRFPLDLKQAIVYINEECFTSRELKINEFIKIHNEMLQNTNFSSSMYKIIYEKVKTDIKSEDYLHMLAYLHPALVLHFKDEHEEENYDEKLEAKQTLFEMQRVIKLIEKYTTLRSFQELTRIDLQEQDKEEFVLRNVLKLISIFPQNLYSFDEVILYTWTYVIKYDELIRDFYCKTISDWTKNTPLHIFIVEQNEIAVNALLNLSYNKININCLNYKSITPLYIAAEHGFKNGVETLVKNGADMNIIYSGDSLFSCGFDSNWHSLLHVAAVNGNEEIVTYLKEFASDLIETVDRNGNTSATLAAHAGYPEVVKILTEDEQLLLTARLYAAVNDDDKKRFLSIVDEIEEKYPTDLFSATFELSTMTFARIEDENSSIMAVGGGSMIYFNNMWENIPWNLSFKLLHAASFDGHLNAVKMILDKGNSTESFTQGSDTPLHLAALNGHLNIVEYFITEKGVDTNIRNEMGSTPLHLSAIGGHFETVKFLITNGADVNSVDEVGATPAFSAAFGNSSKILKYILERENKHVSNFSLQSFNEISILSSRNTTSNSFFSKKAKPMTLLEMLNVNLLHIAVIFDNVDNAKLALDTIPNLDIADDHFILLCFIRIFKSENVLNFLIDNGVVANSTEGISDIVDFFEVFSCNQIGVSEEDIGKTISSIAKHLLNLFNVLKLQKNGSPKYMDLITKVEPFIRNIS